MNDYQLKKCYICGIENADSVDHIPPKNLFLKKYRNKGSDLVTVPAHQKCNKKFEKDDEYFRYFLLIPAYWESELARELWDAKIAKQIHRLESKGFKNYLIQHLIPVELSTPSGIYLGDAEAAALDPKRTDRVIKRIARGIFYKKTQNILPLKWSVDVQMLHPVHRKDRIKLETQERLISIGNGIFKYFWRHTQEDKRISLFWFVFFDCVDFLVFTGLDKSWQNNQLLNV